MILKLSELESLFSCEVVLPSRSWLFGAVPRGGEYGGGGGVLGGSGGGEGLGVQMTGVRTKEDVAGLGLKLKGEYDLCDSVSRPSSSTWMSGTNLPLLSLLGNLLRGASLASAGELGSDSWLVLVRMDSGTRRSLVYSVFAVMCSGGRIPLLSPDGLGQSSTWRGKDGISCRWRLQASP
jgi:hypothetical protein